MKTLLVDAAIFAGVLLLIVLPLAIIGCVGTALFVPDYRLDASHLIMTFLLTWVVTLLGLVWLDGKA